MLFKTPKLLQYIYPKLIWKTEKSIQLTFDDGPIPEVTEFVLDTLSKFDVKATFFCIGANVRKHPEVFLKAVEGGHKIGNHSMHHLNGWKTSTAAYVKDVNDCQQEIELLYNRDKKLFRPPYGRITRAQIEKLIPSYDIMMWSTLSQDYDKNISLEKCLKGTLRATRQNSIVLFHDSLKAKKNMAYVLPKYLESLLKKGYTFN
ncbi:MAG: peptidoglycan/xylan/chitin deacetylase (PgdA/CDA1 family) [Algoriphagus sp.]|jgi:peptidoglycan/xylan/chitin deacetylase (PgdA/CDA1 family)